MIIPEARDSSMIFHGIHRKANKNTHPFLFVYYDNQAQTIENILNQKRQTGEAVAKMGVIVHDFVHGFFVGDFQ